MTMMNTRITTTMIITIRPVYVDSIIHTEDLAFTILFIRATITTIHITWIRMRIPVPVSTFLLAMTTTVTGTGEDGTGSTSGIVIPTGEDIILPPPITTRITAGVHLPRITGVDTMATTAIQITTTIITIIALLRSVTIMASTIRRSTMSTTA